MAGYSARVVLLFIERWYQLLKEGGRLAAVLPDSIFDTSENKYIRLFVLKYFRINAVISVDKIAFQPYTSTKVSILFATKRPKKQVELFEKLWSEGTKRYNELRKEKVIQYILKNEEIRSKLIKLADKYNIDISYVPMYKFIKNKDIKNTANFLLNLGQDYYDAFVDMLVFDALIFNTDRHYGNFGLLVDNKTNKPIKFAPLFDHGLSLFNYALDKDLLSLDEYSKTRTSAFGFDFLLIVKEFITEKQKDKLRKLINFKFNDNKSYHWNTKKSSFLTEAKAMPVLDEVFYAGIHRRDKDDHVHDRIEDRHIRKDHHGDQTDHGAGGLDLAAPAGGDDRTVVGGDHAQAADGKFPRDDDEHQPGRHPAPADENHHAGRHEQLICQRIEEFAEVADLIVMPGDIAVQEVGDAGDDEHSHSRPAQPFRPAGRQKHQDHIHRDQHHTDKGNFTRSRHCILPPAHRQAHRHRRPPHGRRQSHRS